MLLLILKNNLKFAYVLFTCVRVSENSVFMLNLIGIREDNYILIARPNSLKFENIQSFHFLSRIVLSNVEVKLLKQS